MHGRSFLAGLVVRTGLGSAAAALSLAGGVAAADAAPVAFAREIGDAPAMDDLLDDGGDAVDLTSVSAEDWRPDHAAGRMLAQAVPAPASSAPQGAKAPSVTAPSAAAPSVATPAMPATPPKSAAPAARADKSLDPEPDAAVKPPPDGPSHDPLDKTAPAADAAQVPVQPLSPQEAAIKAALDKRTAAALKGPGITEKRKERDAIAFFYAAHGFAPAWSDNGKAKDAVETVLARLAHADEDALKPPAVPKTLAVDGTPEAIAESDIALTEAVVAYARQASGSRIEPRAISPLIGAKPDLADPAEVLDSLAAAGAGAGDQLHALNPADARYAALRDRLAEMRGARGAGRAVIPPGPTLHVGMHDPRVAALRARLDAPSTDTLLDDGVDDPTLYDDALAAAVADFQREHGLPPSGWLTKRTVAALSGGHANASEATLIANMEMWRWMPRKLGADRIEVNVPAFTVTVYHDNDPMAENRVVVGKTDTPTPLFSNVMKYVIVNPMWNVPQSIIKKELLPKGGGSLSYLQGRGYNVSWRHGEYSVQQLSGPKNALGRIKFIFPNDYSVYLHDTPSKSLFSASTRAFSHGCVRVDDPFAFAESVLNDGVPEGGRVLWSQARLDKMIGDKERYINLPEPLPIHIEYFTASVEQDSGRLRVLPDIYGYAHDVAVALGVAPGEAVAPTDRKPRHVAERASRATEADVDPR